MSIAYFSHSKSGCYWYRIKHPMEALNAHGIKTEMVKLNEDVAIDDIKAFQVYGIYPFSFDKVLRTLKEDGKRIVYDIDDKLDSIETTNPFYYSVVRDRGSEREIFKYADHITVATQALADYARTKTTAPITVIPNCYDPKEWTYQRPQREGIRIGFAGSCTHIEDLLMVLPAIKNLQTTYNITFLIMGFSNRTYEEWLRDFRFTSPPEAQKALDEFEALMKDVKFEWIPYVDFDYYPQTLTNMALDIGICPIKDNSFNRARSASKAMEYTLSGALALASNIEAYKHDPTSVLVNDNEWELALENYIHFPEKRKQEHDEHLQWIKDNRNVNSQIDVLKSVYLV